MHPSHCLCDVQGRDGPFLIIHRVRRSSPHRTAATAQGARVATKASGAPIPSAQFGRGTLAGLAAKECPPPARARGVGRHAAGPGGVPLPGERDQGDEVAAVGGVGLRLFHD